MSPMPKLQITRQRVYRGRLILRRLKKLTESNLKKVIFVSSFIESGLILALLFRMLKIVFFLRLVILSCLIPTISL